MTRRDEDSEDTALPDSPDGSNGSNSSTATNRSAPKSNRLKLLVSIIGGILLLLMVSYGIPGDWSYPHYTPLSWSAAVTKVEHAKPGTKVTIPINPEGWTMTLDVHGTKPAVPHRESRIGSTGSTGRVGNTSSTNRDGE